MSLRPVLPRLLPTLSKQASVQRPQFLRAFRQNLSTASKDTPSLRNSAFRSTHFRTQRRLNSSGPKTNTNSSSSSSAGLTREYGWAALGVYLTLSALDFPFCFAAVRLLGVERIGHFEQVVLGYLKETFKSVWPAALSKEKSGEESQAGGEQAQEQKGGEVEKQEEASIWTQLVFAYAIHKSLLIFVRVPLTAAVTPKVVKVLRRWGWDIGKRKPKST
ncbi:hypothetical protein N7532_006239 [Penicillium argentinense]|uniref:DUF1279 domain-containing protein n=1 Tax=Penicillium argentinense TaxID=1131581 RepID=A0A9W9KAR3_9EURO|nr:uncharacterized protein N7532_006239 [Penicillium argentinense]KAJ5099238.1 hypothetical protein N7532_006239 [Penicillium argentinense]